MDGFVGDPIPFHWRGEYHLFYLKRRPEFRGVERLIWAHAVSTDLMHWQELPHAIEMGDGDDPDAEGCWTGSVIECNGTFHIFYTGWNPRLRYRQTICHAVSSDLIHWEKDERNPIIVPDERWYAVTDWRDPFVFWNEEQGNWWMIITARERDEVMPRNGCIALATSDDLQSWKVQPPLWSPNLAHAEVVNPFAL